MDEQRMVVEVRDVLDAAPGSMVFGGGLFLNGSRLPVTVLTLAHVDDMGWEYWEADGWAERITPQ